MRRSLDELFRSGEDARCVPGYNPYAEICARRARPLRRDGPAHEGRTTQVQRLAVPIRWLWQDDRRVTPAATSESTYSTPGPRKAQPRSANEYSAHVA